MSRKANFVTAPQQFENNEEHRRNRLRVQTHFQLFDHHPFDRTPAQGLRRGQQPVQSEEQGDEFALTGGPHHVRNLRTVPSEHQAFLWTRLIKFQLEAAKDGFRKQGPDLCFHLPGLRIDGSLTSSDGFHQPAQFLAEIANRKRITCIVIVERPEPPVRAECHHTLSGYEEAPLGAVLLFRSDKSLKIYRKPFPRYLAVSRLPDTSSPLPEIEFQEVSNVLVPIQSVFIKISGNGIRIEEELQKLEENTLAGCLGAYQYGQVAKLNVGFTYRANILQLQSFIGHMEGLPLQMIEGTARRLQIPLEIFISISIAQTIALS